MTFMFTFHIIFGSTAVEHMVEVQLGVKIIYQSECHVFTSFKGMLISIIYIFGILLV